MEITAQRLIEYEPKLKEVEKLAHQWVENSKANPMREYYPAYADCKKKSIPLIGWYCQNREICSSHAYEIWIDHILSILEGLEIISEDEEDDY